MTDKLATFSTNADGALEVEEEDWPDVLAERQNLRAEVEQLKSDGLAALQEWADTEADLESRLGLAEIEIEARTRLRDAWEPVVMAAVEWYRRNQDDDEPTLRAELFEQVELLQQENDE